MSDDLARKRLGRGLAALIGEIERPAEPEKPAATSDGRLPIEFVRPNPRNPRRHFGEAELDELAQSIREHGIVQPVVVRPVGDSRFEIIAGERRWRAAQRAGLVEVPVIVRDVNDRTALELAIIENVQRADLNPLEEAQGYQQLIDEHGYTQADLGQVVGKSRSHVANTLRLLKLPDSVRSMLNAGELSAGHARTLVAAADPSGLAKRIVDGGLSVRQAEALAQRAHQEEARKPSAITPEKDSDTLALERLLSDATGLDVVIRHKERGGGEIRVGYRTLEQLDEVCRRLRG
jgi:ParB family chromosome partitioning protein